jgi:hypothetical protein
MTHFNIIKLTAKYRVYANAIHSFVKYDNLRGLVTSADMSEWIYVMSIPNFLKIG